MKSATFFLLLVTIAGIAADDTHNPHCDHDEQKLKEVVACVKQKATDEIFKKLEAARKALQCPDIECGVRKLCRMHNGAVTAEVTRRFYSDEVKAIIRGHFDSCRDQV
ncbi:uncharacterized protein LOC119399554 [Rhipicephalus sanguineus]|uniref:uncharacterized protein LOC119399554 n=1 Tax=Rhipicephalus sanguineus TaxID=34632 RepID=UPI0018949F58|nr:uncharacterized protein LOC119399554 [Rhipicephalus sanguineus]